jgi:hypothetical protein
MVRCARFALGTEIRTPSYHRPPVHAPLHAFAARSRVIFFAGGEFLGYQVVCRAAREKDHLNILAAAAQQFAEPAALFRVALTLVVGEIHLTAVDAERAAGT